MTVVTTLTQCKFIQKLGRFIAHPGCPQRRSQQQWLQWPRDLLPSAAPAISRMCQRICNECASERPINSASKYNMKRLLLIYRDVTRAQEQTKHVKQPAARR